MAAGVLEGREILVSRLKSQLGTLVSSVEIAGQNNLSSSHVVAETTLAGLLNRVYGWELVNANALWQNCPGVDLIDEKRKIAVQVTATRTAEKVRHTLEEVGKSGVRYERLIVLTITNLAPTEGMLTCAVPTYSGTHEIWNIPHVFRDAKELDPVKLDDLTAYMAAELGPVKERVRELPHLELPPSSALEATGFVGREAELAQIHSRFAGGDRLVVLTGLGGMGKTELAAKYGRDHPGLVYFIRFDTNFTRTLFKMAEGIRPKLTEQEQRLEEGILIKRVLTLLERSSPDDLLIIDNADSDTGVLADLQGDEGYKRIRELPLKLLLTTRSDAPRAIQVKPMPNEPLFDIFRNHGAELTETEMEDLIQAVNGHTLTIDLIARTLADNWVPVSTEEMLDAIVNNTLPEGDFPEVGTDYNQDPEQLHIYQQLRRVFQVAKIPPLEQQILRCATLLPEAGMDVRLFRGALTDELRRVFPGLGKRGWLSAEQKKLTIHPVIRLVCLNELKPTDESCGAFLDALIGQYDATDYQLDRYRQMAELLNNASTHLTDTQGRWALKAGERWRDVGEFAKAQDWSLRATRQMEETLSPDAPELAQAYNNVGVTYSDLGDHRTALEYKQKALTIREKVLPPEHLDLAQSYNNVGSTYGALGDHRTALEYQKKALAIREKALPPEHPDLAMSYNNVGYTYGALGDHRKALEYHQKALVIREKALPPEHPDLAMSYNNVGYTYGALGDHRKALEYHQKALAIYKTALPPEHPDLAISYSHMGSTYGDLGDHRKALEYTQKTLAIYEKALPPEHPHLATAYNNVGGTYGDLGDHRKALEYQQKALAIWEKALPPEHPYIATSYNNVGNTYGHLNDHRKALEYHKKALSIREKALPPEHPDFAMSYNNVGCTYGALGDHRTALEYQKKALAIREKVLPPEHPDFANSCNNIAWTYYELGDLPAAAEYMRRAADIISRSSLPKTHPHRVNFPKWAAELEKEAKMQQAIQATMRQFGQPPFPFGKK